MSSPNKTKRLLVVPLLISVALVVTWQVVLAQAPTPNPLPNVTGVDIEANGPAASIHGDPFKGRQIFVENCAECHGDRGIMGEDNPGSEDGTVPALNPAPEFVEASGGDPEAFAKAIDLFIQHGSRPAGDDPEMSMKPFGDKKLLTPAEIADVEAYVMQLNNITWPDRWYPPAEVDMTATRAGNKVTYTINVLNQGGATLSDVLLRVTLPPGLAFVQSDFFGLGNNPAQVVGSTVQWLPGDIPQGGSQGPFTFTAGLTGTDVPPVTAQVLFHYSDFSGTDQPASALSEPVVPGK